MFNFLLVPEATHQHTPLCCISAMPISVYMHANGDYGCFNLQMSQKIEELEKTALGEKPWQLAGEVTAQSRPENSMLEEDVEFEQTSRMGE